MNSRVISYLFCLILFIGTSFTSRKELVIELVDQTKQVLPKNWFLVQTDSSFSVYFCETALDLPVTHEGVFVPDEDIYGEQLWGAPWPDSVYVVEFDQQNKWSKGTKTSGEKYKYKPNAILQIDVFVGEQTSDQIGHSMDNFPLIIRKTVPLKSTIQFKENRKPKDQCYRDNGLTLQAEYERLFLNLNFMLGIKNPD